jgi:hypothetical protein
MWDGYERRSQRSLAVRAHLAAEEQVHDVELRLKATPRWQVRRTADLRRALRRARSREQTLRAALEEVVPKGHPIGS